MTFNERYDVNQEDENIFSFKSKQEEYEHEAKILMFKFLSEVEKLNDFKKLLKKDLASAIGTSASYITQLYNGDKLINLITLAKLQDVYNVEFEVKAVYNTPGVLTNIGIDPRYEHPKAAFFKGYEERPLTVVPGGNYYASPTG